VSAERDGGSASPWANPAERKRVHQDLGKRLEGGCCGDRGGKLRCRTAHSCLAHLGSVANTEEATGSTRGSTRAAAKLTVPCYEACHSPKFRQTAAPYSTHPHRRSRDARLGGRDETRTSDSGQQRDTVCGGSPLDLMSFEFMDMQRIGTPDRIIP
jgi:hypothetical protein